jgi:transposase
LLRHTQPIRHTPEPAEYAPRIIGLDDFALRKGQRYGTILVDLQTHRPIDVLSDRTADTLIAWLRKHPCIEVISRDRSTEYSRAIGIGAPQARQIADRFHLVKNLREGLERLIDRNRTHLRGIRLPYTSRKDNSQAGLPASAARRPAKRAPAEVSARAARRNQRQAVLAQVLDLRKEGISISSIAKRLPISRQTVYRYLRSDTDPTARLKRHRPSTLDPYLSYLYERWQQGCENGLQLWREIRDQGYLGSRKMVAVSVSQQRKSPAKNDPYKNRDPSSTQERWQDLQRQDRQVSTRSLSYFLLREQSSLSAEEHTMLERIQAASSDLARGYELLQEFMDMMRQRSATRLDEWLVKAKTSNLPDFENFAEGIERDKAAVVGGLSEEWSNGQPEGHVNRLKLLKRSMYGRANFDLLRLRVLQST